MHSEPICAAMFAALLLPIHAASDLTNVLNTYSGTYQDGVDGATQVDLVMELSTSRLEGGRTEVASTVARAWTRGVLDDLRLNVRAKGVLPASAQAN